MSRGTCAARKQRQRRYAIRCLLDDVSKRFDFLLSSLSLCLRVVSLTQSPSTSDLHKLAIACQGGIASLAAVRITKTICIADSR